MNSDYITQATAAEMLGMSVNNFKKLNIAPDKIVKNPHYRQMSMYLFNRSSIAQLIGTPSIANLQKKQKNVEASKKAVLTKKIKIQNIVKSIEIKIEADENIQNVTQQAVSHYNAHLEDKIEHLEEIGEDTDCLQYAGVDSGESFLERITVNYLRHECTIYDSVLDDLIGKVGKREAYILLKERVFNLIADKYPSYEIIVYTKFIV